MKMSRRQYQKISNEAAKYGSISVALVISGGIGERHRQRNKWRGGGLGDKSGNGVHRVSLARAARCADVTLAAAHRKPGSVAAYGRTSGA
jgi:hypothetical protein